MTDIIRLKGLRFFTHVGCTVEERKVGQYLDIDVEMMLDLREATSEDAIAKSLDYSEAVRVIGRAIAGREANLIETLAERAATAVLGLGADEVVVRIRKPAPPMPVGHAEYAEVEIRRARR